MTGAIFADTSFIVASLLASDSNHAQARSLTSSLGRVRLVTTNLVRGETWTFLNRRSGHRRAVEFLDGVARSRSIQVVTVDDPLEAEALRWLRRHDEREYSFVDATSFALMRREGIERSLAFDGDFTAAGFVELRA